MALPPSGSILIALAAALPWVIIPLALLWRSRDSRALAEESSEPPLDAPLVSVIVPARDEARNIGRCVRSVLSSTYPALEVIVVDDHSSDATGALALAASNGDTRLRVIEPPPLPEGWFGKQWACASGARVARGDILCFADADTEHAPDLVTRSVKAMRGRRADLFSIAGRQELGSFWERLIQPQVFTMLLARYGGTETVARSRHAHGKIANGQCIFVRRAAYDAIGGHAAVRDKVAEDLMLAQRMFSAGHHIALAIGTEQLSTRMYTSLRELVAGWSKNIYAGGVDAMPFGRIGRMLFPVALLLPFVLSLAPPVALLLAWMLPPAAIVWAAAATLASLAFWTLIYVRIGESAGYALLYPLGAALLLWIAMRAVIRGRRVAWKGREYIAR